MATSCTQQSLERWMKKELGITDKAKKAKAAAKQRKNWAKRKRAPRSSK